MTQKLSLEEKNTYKSRGIVHQKQEGYFAIRAVGKSGIFTAEEMGALVEAAQTYGNGELNLTSRLTVEIPYVKYEDIDQVVKSIEASGLIVGGGGKTVRAIVSCKGTVCPNGLIDTQKIATEVHQKFFALPVPAKLKIGIFGCKNSFGKSQTQDIGIMPLKGVHMESEQCIGCGICVKQCPDEAFEYEEGIYRIKEDKCTLCGKCIDFCPADSIKGKEEVELLVFIGGRMGRKPSLAKPLSKKFKEEEIVEVIGDIINYFRANGRDGERFSQMIERIGFEKVEKELLK